MKKTILFTAIMIIASLFIVLTSFATDKPVKDTTVKINGVSQSYKMYVGIKGGKYIIVTSKTGSTYKKYFKASK